MFRSVVRSTRTNEVLGHVYDAEIGLTRTADIAMRVEGYVSDVVELAGTSRSPGFYGIEQALSEAVPA